MKCPTRKLSDNRNWKLDVTFGIALQSLYKKDNLVYLFMWGITLSPLPMLVIEIYMGKEDF